MSNTLAEPVVALELGEDLVLDAALDVGPARIDALFRLLSHDEQARALRFVFELHRRRYAAARGLLRETLGRLLPAEPASLHFEYGPHGKPRLGGARAAVGFNVSHSGERALFAFARERELGVDIEAVRAEIDHAAIASRFFSPGEQRALRELPEPDRAAGFFRIWTRKEAYVKLLGGGLAIGLDAFDVSLDEPARLLRTAVPAAEHQGQVRLHSLAAAAGFEAALAYSGGAAVVRAARLA